MEYSNFLQIQSEVCTLGHLAVPAFETQMSAVDVETAVSKCRWGC